ncbi:MAG: 16S rRNA (uracil(1498)-N(3))-methyltransferase [Planctomycetaceae bacterium]|nr:16S rRNA (uracil(1498)-N(3))-methyltransferase [Planctomycetaceae bacterium]
MASRYYYEGSLQPGNIELTDSEAHHLIHVKRARVGECIEVFDGQGNAVEAEVIELKKKLAVLKIDQQFRHDEEQSRLEIVLASAIPKSDRFRWLIEKATEIGVTQFIPLITQRSVVSPRNSKLEKHRQYVIEACKQSGRNHLMQISASMTLNELCTESEKTTQIFVGHPGTTFASLEQFQQCLKTTTTSLLLVVGPEGGLTNQELNLLDDKNVIRVCCSPHILRIETAGLVMSTVAVCAVNSNAETKK